MIRAAKAANEPGTIRVGTAELRSNLAKYLKLAQSGQKIVILQRGQSAYVLSRFEEPTPGSVLGCMRERTKHTPGEVVNAGESWEGGTLP